MRHKIIAMVVIITLMIGLLSFVSLAREPAVVLADPHPGQSHNVAVIGSLGVWNGGWFPTTTTGPTGSFNDFHCTNLAVANVNAANLANFDTVLLNVAGYDIHCDMSLLTAAQKQDLVNFVGQGKKLIIYDSECSAQNYDWLPYHFTTNNPGAMGAAGTLTIVEENTLSSNLPANVHYINAPMLSTQSDAIGDMNVMTTWDPNWCIDMSGTNYNNVTGPVHTYARFGTVGHMGLIIYNGMDMDYLWSDSVPDSATPAGNLAKIWL